MPKLRLDDGITLGVSILISNIKVLHQVYIGRGCYNREHYVQLKSALCLTKGALCLTKRALCRIDDRACLLWVHYVEWTISSTGGALCRMTDISSLLGVHYV